MGTVDFFISAENLLRNQTYTALMAPTTATSTTGGSGGPAQGGGEYRWSTLPSIVSQVEGCHLVPMKAPHAEGESGGLTIKQVKETCPGVVKVITLVNLDKKFKGSPKMYTREEVYGEGLLLGQMMCKPIGHPDSEPYPSEKVFEQFLKEVDVEGLVAVHCT